MPETTQGRIDGRRIRAVMAYADITQEEIADHIDLVSVDTLRRWGRIGASLDVRHTRRVLRELAALAGLPEEFFYVDLQQLHMLPTTPATTPADAEAAATWDAAQAAEQAAERLGEDRRRGARDRRRDTPQERSA